jgi:hypothetical protein
VHNDVQTLPEKEIEEGKISLFFLKCEIHARIK